jgi:integrase
MAMDLVVYNPASQVRQLKEKESVHTSLSLEQQQQIWRGCHQWKDRLLVGLALTTGLRGETLAKLDAADIDFEHRCLNIPSAKMKAGRNHVIPLPDWVLAIIKEGPYNGVTLFGKYARTAEGVAYHWNAICRRAGLDGGGIRTARRTFATTMLRSGVDLKTVQDLLGHRNIATTSRYLTPADLPTARAAVEKIPPPNA